MHFGSITSAERTAVPSGTTTLEPWTVNLPQSVLIERRPSPSGSRVAEGPDWDRYADEGQATHVAFLGDTGFVWAPRDTPRTICPSWVTSKVATTSRSGAAPASACAGSALAAAASASTSAPGSSSTRCSWTRYTGIRVPSVRGTARVLRPGGRFAFSVTHPTRWMFPDDPGEAGLTATQSYWDRTPYVEVDDASGVVAYVEHHRTLGDWVRLLSARDFRLVDLVEPEWPEQNDRVWGGWSRARGLLTPGTAIFVADLLG